MASFMCRSLRLSNLGHRRCSVLASTRSFSSSSDALVEINPGEVGIISGIPEEHLRGRVSDLGTRALAISLPFACVLGVLSSLIASTIVSKSCIWAYASFQFAVVILFAHFVYNMLNVDSFINSLLSSFTGFAIAFTANALIVECLRWRENRYLSLHIYGVTREQLRRSLHEYNQQHRPPQQQQQSMENLHVGPMDGAGQVEVKIQTYPDII